METRDVKVKVHVAGLPLAAANRYVRQRCAWCGEILVDVDSSNLDFHPAFQVGAWIMIGTCNCGEDHQRVVQIREAGTSGDYHPESCMAETVHDRADPVRV